MKFALLCLVSVAIAFGAIASAGQEKPSFSGEWVADPEAHGRVRGEITRPPIAPNGADGDRYALRINQEGSTLVLDGWLDFGLGKPVYNKTTFNLDGSETMMIVPDGKTVLVRAAWEGSSLVLVLHDAEIKQDVRKQTWAIRNGRLVTITEVIGSNATRYPGERPAPIVGILKRR